MPGMTPDKGPPMQGGAPSREHAQQRRRNGPENSDICVLGNIKTLA
jgi:hypothetical protein